jgi:hypothetical protein
LENWFFCVVFNLQPYLLTDDAVQQKQTKPSTTITSNILTKEINLKLWFDI